VKLLNRSTRSLGLTEAGKIYYQGCRRMLFEAQDVHEQLYAFNNTPIGTLRVGCSSTMAQNVLAHITAGMLKEYPGLSVNLVTGIPAPDLIADGLDVVIRVGALQDSSLFSRRLGSMPMVLCAAKSYLQQAGIPEKPADLASHSWLEYSVRPDNEFEIIAPEGISTKLIPQGRFVTNDPMTLVRWLTAGVGVAYVPLMWAIEEINRGELEILLPSYQSDPRPVYALYTEKDKLPLKVQVCINSLTEYFVEVAKIYQGCTAGELPASDATQTAAMSGAGCASQMRKRIQNTQAVPPTVRLSTFSVGWPTPTGTLWPSLPHTPTPLSSFRSLPTMEICCIASIPEIRVAPSPLS
jgi:DNA-binding transcriptional LysR family regulator